MGAAGPGRLRLLAEPLPLVLLAGLAGLLAPSASVARRSDAILAALVLAVVLAIEPRRLLAVLASWRRVIVLSLLPFLVLLPLAVGLGRLFAEPERSGLLTLGLAPTEVASAGLVALARGDPALALAAVILSLVASAALVPVAVPLLTDGVVEPLGLVGRFSLVVLVPLAAGLAIRLAWRSAPIAGSADRAATLLLALLVYAALGDAGEGAALGSAALAASLFLGASAALSVAVRLATRDLRTGAFAFSLRDFAVAAALGVQLEVPGAAATAATYGALMLVAAAAAAALLRRDRP